MNNEQIVLLLNQALSLKPEIYLSKSSNNGAEFREKSNINAQKSQFIVNEIGVI